MSIHRHPTMDGAGQGPAGRIADRENGGQEPRRATPKVTCEEVDRVLGKPHTPAELLRVAKGWLEGKEGRDRLEAIVVNPRLYSAVAIACETEANNPEADKRVVDELAAVRFELFKAIIVYEERLYANAGEYLVLPLILPGVGKLLRNGDGAKRAGALETVTDELALAEIAIEYSEGYPADVRNNALEKLSARMDKLGLAGLLAVAAYSKDEEAVGAAKDRIHRMVTGDEREAAKRTEAFFSNFFTRLGRFEGKNLLQHALPVYEKILEDKCNLREMGAEERTRTQWGMFLFEMQRLLQGNGVFGD